MSAPAGASPDDLTPEDIARLLPEGWAYTYPSLEVALSRRYPDGIPA